MSIPIISKKISKHFSLGEIKELCFDLEIDFDDIPGDTKSLKTRELVSYCTRRGLINQLLDHCQKSRPHVEWLIHKEQNEQSNRVGYILSEVITMAFVDLMRLLSIRSDSLVFEVNENRYDEFATMAQDRIEELKSQMLSFEKYLSNNGFSEITTIERTLRWVLFRVQEKPNQPDFNIFIYEKMLTLSNGIHQFCLNSGHQNYTIDISIVDKVIQREFPKEERLQIKDFAKLRNYLQTKALMARNPESNELYGIWFDANYELAFTYYGIDKFLLAQMFSKK